MNEWERDRRRAERYKEMYPVGTRLELIQMGDDPHPVPPGTRGTVAYVDDMDAAFRSSPGRTASES